jgi:hypothetical protein
MGSRRIHDGGCLCGGVRYRVEGEPNPISYCHCRMCQRAVGAPVTAWASVPAKEFQILQGRVVEYASSAGVQRGFCGTCGASLTARYALQGEPWVDFTVATLDDPSTMVPTSHIHMSSRVPWFHIADDLPRYDDQGQDPKPDQYLDS